MKKIIAIVLAMVIVLALGACGTINDTEVSILWSGESDQATVPNSLINAVDRAMYIEKISYKHYAAAGNQSTQTQQAKTALDAGCAALMVELVDPTAAQEIVDLAKAKNVPVVFFNCEVDAAVVASYDKCGLVTSDEATMASVYGLEISKYAIENMDALDRNEDGVLTYFAVGDMADLVAEIDKNLTAEGQKALKAAEGTELASILPAEVEGEIAVELILTASDEEALTVLKELQAKGYNSTKLKTHCVALFTVGLDADASAFTDTSAMTEEELDALIYNAMNVIDAGQMAATALVDYDTMAVTAAAMLSSFLEGGAPAETTAAVPYTVYTAS